VLVLQLAGLVLCRLGLSVSTHIVGSLDETHETNSGPTSIEIGGIVLGFINI